MKTADLYLPPLNIYLKKNWCTLYFESDSSTIPPNLFWSGENLSSRSKAKMCRLLSCNSIFSKSKYILQHFHYDFRDLMLFELKGNRQIINLISFIALHYFFHFEVIVESRSLISRRKLYSYNQHTRKSQHL